MSKYGQGTSQAAKARENRARRAAARQGYTLAKIQLRDPNALGYGRYLLRDDQGDIVRGTSHLVRGVETGRTLDEIEDRLGISRADDGDE
jgi:hypothetical protein